MSYILDALQRAALERERAKGNVPGLQTRSIAATTATRRDSAVIRYRWPLLALFVALVMTAASIILWRASPVSPPRALSAPEAPLDSAPPVAPGVTQPAAPAAITSLPAPAVASPPVVSEPSRLNPPSPLPATVSPTFSTAPTTSPPSAPSTPVVKAPAEAQQSVSALEPRPQPSASAPQTPKATLPFLKDLPDALRTQMPPLSISGVVYSDNPAQRLLLINGLVLTQGSRVAEDLVLDEIHPRSSDLTFKGTRFKLSH